MRRIMLASVMIAVILGVNLTAAFGCGDKTLRIGRGARFKRTGRAAAVLIYVPSDAPATAMERLPRLQSFLKKYGDHKARVVQGPDRLSEYLDSGQYDVVLSGLGEAANVQQRVASSSQRTVVIPMIIKATKAELAAARRQFNYIVKDANSGDDYLDAIEEVMKSKTRKA